jgi:hypothetical protein
MTHRVSSLTTIMSGSPRWRRTRVPSTQSPIPCQLQRSLGDTGTELNAPPHSRKQYSRDQRDNEAGNGVMTGHIASDAEEPARRGADGSNHLPGCVV